jgi:hypothetical protein
MIKEEIFGFWLEVNGEYISLEYPDKVTFELENARLFPTFDSVINFIIREELHMDDAITSIKMSRGKITWSYLDCE